MASTETFLEFGISILDAHFPMAGRYHLSLTLEVLPEPPGGGYENVCVQRHPSEDPTPERVTYTDSVEQKLPSEQAQPPKLVMFGQENTIFLIPKSYVIPTDVNDDADHQMVLLVEAVREELDRELVVGKGVVKIFPHPRANSSVPAGIPWYITNEVLVLARLLEADGLPVMCGRVRCSTRLRQAPAKPRLDVPSTATTDQKVSESTTEDRSSTQQRVIRPEIKPLFLTELPTFEPTWPEETAVPPIDVGRTPEPPQPPLVRAREWARPLEDRLELKIDTPAPELPDIKVDVYPMSGDQEAAGVDWGECPVSARGTETVTVNVYAAANLPPLPSGKPPTPFVILGLTCGGRAGSSTSATRSSIKPCCNPTWHESLSLSMPETAVKDQELVLSVVDSSSRQLLVSYQIPLTFLQTFHHYHLNLVTAVTNHTGGVHLYVSILRTGHKLPKLTGRYGLEVSLHGIQEPLKHPCRPLMAVARIEEDLGGYQQSVGEDLNRAAGVPMTMVTFPSPHPSWFQIPKTEGYGISQVSLLGQPADQPQWDHTFLFVNPGDTTTMSSFPLAALIIELYPMRAPKATLWRIDNAVGFCSLLLSKNVLDQLAQAHKSNLSLRVPGLVVQGGILLTEENKTPSVDLALRLIQKEEEVSGSVSDRSYLQQLSFSPPPLEVPLYRRSSQQICFSDIHLDANHDAKGRPRPSQSGTTLVDWVARSPHHGEVKVDHPPRVRRAFKPTDGELPSHDAMENLLPEYQYIVMDKDSPHLHPKKAGSKASTPRPEDVERVSMSLLDYQQQELEKYRQAVQTMGHDILSLRQEVRRLEEANSLLRRDLDHYNDSTKLLLDAQELDGLSRADLAERYVALKHNLSRQSGELRDYKDKVLRLQNELIKKNDREKEYGRLSDAHQGQQEVVQRLQDRANKVRRLEDVIRKQEKVIEKMEKIINSRTKGTTKDLPSQDNSVNEALMEENRRLRAELENATEAAQKSSRETEDEDRERLDLYTRLERSQARILSLEKQLADNARQWARERSDLVLKLQESDAGLTRTSPLPNIRTSPSHNTVPKLKPRRDDPKGEQRRFSHYHPEPLPDRRNRPHIGYNTPHYDPVLHS